MPLDFYTLIIISVFVILFFAGTALLIRKNEQRYLGIIFLIRTKYGINFIKKLSKLPGWKFIADFAIVASLSGIGALYLSSQGRAKNLSLIFPVFGIFACFLNFHTAELFIAGTIFVLLVAAIIRKFPNHYLIFAIFSILIFTITARGYLIIFPHAQMEILTTLSMSILISIFGLPAFILGALTLHAYEIIFMHSEIPGISPMLPGVKDGEIGLGFLGYSEIFIPIWYGIITLIVLLTSHEISHGILSYVHKINLKSTGLLTFGIIPIGAFVEPDEDAMKKSEGYKRMQIYVMGSFANFAVAMLGVLLLTLLVSAAYSPDNGMLVGNVMNDSPAYYANLSEGTTIYKVNDENPWKQLKNLSQNKTVILETNKGNFTITTTQHPNIEGRGYIGITYSLPINKGLENSENFINILLELLKWIVLLNFLVGITNLMPVSPFDGGKMTEEIIASLNLNKKIVEHIVLAIIGIVLFLIIINAFPILKIISDIF
ncbi:MAG: hypothetical protein COV98_01455 [Candidatus Altarchaeum sp. CG12_big_fil_rev_8_21_14_0_65_33_22]|nr:MAG: hypothetical protein AUK59_05170 [Candidatus Altarchaeum sp. CG2_30_32_3053]PIN67819.1 MAG: hypothetical protein COV98_01455 [Candidatus Altarchaeum sp. CG12_big_fil_rev_8_21_14_0_65_33_22]PIV27492.1 MAG: hypothetical protein COS36_05535 [Candidatus Altarchaeum sp. CG03_land_8_20_14_0_80_32_618]PIX48179.1 MAG: hypothetical protein COZ53_04890 [Candidatus Altarchaeum sp. CG_4_8_14_3_um_filter_33_2054]PIZ29721.1 MAG: hypothetical protein COY41_05200 [Candidatus Altarchaeum sp. CG_4_10_14_